MPRHNGMASRVHREDWDDYSVVVGFGHAAYAIFQPDGSLVTFIGWWQSSQWTRSHLKVLRPIADEERRGKPEVGDGKLVVTTQSSEVPDVLPPTMYEYETPAVADAHGVTIA